MHETTACSDDRLRQLLQESESSSSLVNVAEHLDHCPYCQSRIQEIAAELDQWHLVKASLSSGDDVDATNHWHRTHLKNRYRAVESISWSQAMAKQLLGPPSHPEMMGRLGRYEVERLIGSGGMGVVFKAFDSELNRPVAIKVLAPYLAGSSAARKRFAREARAAAAIVHDHVVPIHNVETEQSTPFLVMQYIAGDSLQARIDKEGALDVCEILRIGKQVASGLAAAHAQGLIHRDVKPSNILLDENVSRALLTDFGLARAEDEACLTRSGFQPGTPHYMSPEQIRAEVIDGRSDLFGLGCVLYALCTGHPPFRAEGSYAVMRRITDDTPRSIRELNPLIPNWLEHIVMKLLAKQRTDRYQSANEVAELLEACLAHVHQPSSTPLPESLTAESSARRTFSPRAKWSAGIAVTLAVALVSGYSYFSDDAKTDDRIDSAQVVAANADAFTANNKDESEGKIPAAAPPINTIDDLIAVIAEIEQSYFPYHIKYSSFRDPKPGREMSDAQRARYHWYDGRTHESRHEDAQLSIDHWFQKEASLIDDVMETRYQKYHTPTQEVSISEPKGAIGPNPTNEAQFIIQTKPRGNFRQSLSLVLSGLFPSIFMQTDLRLSQVIKSDASNAKLSWDGDDAVLEFEYQPAPEAKKSFCRVWYSRQYAWHPIRFQKFFDHDRKTWHTQWSASKITNQKGIWRVKEGDFIFHDYNFDGPLAGVITSRDIFTISEAHYGPDAASTSMEYVIPEKVFMSRDGQPITAPESDERHSIEVKLVDLNDQPVSNAVVRFSSLNGLLLQKAITDQQGIAKTEHGVSTTIINIEAAGYRPSFFALPARQNSTAVRLLPKSTGIIVDATGQPLKNLAFSDQVWFRADGLITQDDMKNMLADHSDEDGRFILNSKTDQSVNPDTPILLVATEPSNSFMMIAQMPARQLSEELKLEGRPVCRISGSFVVPGNQTTSEFRAWVETKDGLKIGDIQPLTKAESGETIVSYKLRLPAGTYRIRCRDTLQNFEGVQELNITDGQQEYDVARSEMASTKFMALVGDLAPGLNVKWRPGDEVWLHELKGKVVVIDFWADWCIPCVQQMPALIDIAVQYKDKPIEWIAIHSATQDSVEGMEQTIDTLSKQRWNKPLPFHVALDARRPGTRSTGETDSAYHVAEWPTLVVIKPDGTVYGRVTKDSLSAVIDKLLTSTKQ